MIPVRMGVSVVSSRGADFHPLIYASGEIYFFVKYHFGDSGFYLQHNYVIKISLPSTFMSAHSNAV